MIGRGAIGPPFSLSSLSVRSEEVYKIHSCWVEDIGICPRQWDETAKCLEAPARRLKANPSGTLGIPARIHWRVGSKNNSFQLFCSLHASFMVGDFKRFLSGGKGSRSPPAADIIAGHRKLRLLRPNATRLNLLLILRITREKGEGALAAVCTAL